MNQAILLPDPVPPYGASLPEENEKKKPDPGPDKRSIFAITEDGYKEISLADKIQKKKNKEFEALNRKLNSFSYIASHDLQEPLRKIQTFSSRILEKEQHNLSELGKEYFDRMQKAAKRMQVLIQDLSAYSKLDSADKEFKRMPFDEIIYSVKQDLKEMIKKKNASIEHSSLCEVYVIPYQFRQLIFNILSNALKFSHPDRQPLITVKARLLKHGKFPGKKNPGKTSYCHIIINDNGLGFDSLYSKRIFEVFQRIHGRDDYEGTGIGLAICKKIVKNHNGIIKAKGVPGIGASFEIYIPTD